MLVTFRVSAEEHAQLRDSSLKSGARSISEFVRMAALQKVQRLNGPESGLTGDLMTLGKGLRDLDVLLGDLKKKLRSVLGPAPRGPEYFSDLGPIDHDSKS
jgi:hypothetical protein